MKMVKVIGGEFKISGISESVITKHETILFSSGRSALSAIFDNLFMRKGSLNKVIIPDYLCSSITKVLLDRKIDYSFYKIKDSLLPDEDSIFENLKDPKIVLLINYYGLVSVKSIAEKIKLLSPKSIIIVDDVQNYYGEEYKEFADYRFTSYRKWFAVPDGATVYSRFGDVKPSINKNNFAQYKFAGNLLKNYEDWVEDSICLDLLNKGENILDSEYDVACSEISKLLIQRIPYDEIRMIRKRNAAYLHNKLSDLCVKHLYNEESIPLFIPIFLGNRTEVRRAMFKNNIFTPVHWPYESELLNGKEKNILYDTELSLICDQRYSEVDMNLQIDILKTFV